MLIDRRHLTAAVLLASYLFANGSAWLHTGHECHGPACLHDVEQNADLCHSHEHASPQDMCRAAKDDPAVAQDDGNGRKHQDRDEDCSICRFQMTQKSAEYAPCSSATLNTGPQPLIVAPPSLRVAQLPATPDSRAPPAVA